MIEKEDVVENRTDHMDRPVRERSHGMGQKILPAEADPDEEWVKEYIEQFGSPPSFF
ncbi:MAG: hypothetical protein HFH54_02900 [Lachnospiraceae bacterium]|nr:hypothetical protein [Lachnospiraceae bacterium]